jgi:hypothetical protein
LKNTQKSRQLTQSVVAGVSFSTGDTSMADIEEFKSKVKSLNSLLNPENYTGNDLSVSELNELGILSLTVGAVVNDLKNSGGTQKDLDDAYSSLEEIERKANVILPMSIGMKFFLIVGFGLTIGLPLYVWIFL